MGRIRLRFQVAANAAPVLRDRGVRELNDREIWHLVRSPFEPAAIRARSEAERRHEHDEQSKREHKGHDPSIRHSLHSSKVADGTPPTLT